jgi:hypothetical protein
VLERLHVGEEHLLGGLWSWGSSGAYSSSLSAFSHPPSPRASSSPKRLGCKYLSPKKVNRRKALWPGAEWEHILVHAAVRYPEELQESDKHGVELILLEQVLENLCPPERPPFTASAGGDLADLIDFYGRTRHLPLPDESEDENQIEERSNLTVYPR